MGSRPRKPAHGDRGSLSPPAEAPVRLLNLKRERLAAPVPSRTRRWESVAVSVAPWSSCRLSLETAAMASLMVLKHTSAVPSSGFHLMDSMMPALRHLLFSCFLPVFLEMPAAGGEGGRRGQGEDSGELPTRASQHRQART